jgi:hypothetical protein
MLRKYEPPLHKFCPHKLHEAYVVKAWSPKGKAVAVFTAIATQVAPVDDISYFLIPL